MHSQKGNFAQKLLHMAIVVGLSVLCLTSIEMASAKYISQSHGNDSASVASFSPSLVYDNNIDISDIKKPGDSTEKTFKVQNFSGGSVSEVTMTYTMTLKTTGNLPLCFTLLDADGNTLAVWDCDGTSGQQKYEYESPLVFSPGVAQTHDYTIRAQWQSDRNAAQFAGMTDAVYVSVKWEQVD